MRRREEEDEDKKGIVRTGKKREAGKCPGKLVVSCKISPDTDTGTRCVSVCVF